jgi:hypothetical protein
VKITLAAFLVFLGAFAVVYFFGNVQQQHLVGNIGQLTALILGTVNLFRLAGVYSKGDPPRRAWMLFAFGMLIWVVAQSVVMYLEIVVQTLPHGSPADIFWVIGYLFFITGLVLLLKNFKETGLPLGSQTSYLLQTGIFVVVFSLLFWTLILPLLKSPNREIILNFLDIGYPAIDFVLIFLCSILLRFSWILRGSGLSKSWILLCSGFAILAFADICLSYTTDVHSFLNRILDPIYFSAYFILGLSAANQLSVQRKLLSVHR